MIKTGIYNLQDIKSAGTTTFRKELKNVSITLYEDIQDQSNADDLAERILLLFSDERSAYKRTYVKRFEEFDSIVIKYLRGRFKNADPLTFHDVGVSDGRTALNFFEKIVSDFPHIQYTASDYNPKVYVLEKGKCKVTLSHTGRVLEILQPPFVFNTIKRDSIRHYPLNHLIRFVVQFLVVSPLVKKYESGKINAKELMLFAPQVLKAAKSDSRFIATQHDLLQAFKEQVHAIRAMNVLNPSYFSEKEFSKILKHIHDGLKEDGILITGSNEEAGTIVHGGIYKKTRNSFQKIEHSGEGSPIERFIVDPKI